MPAPVSAGFVFGGNARARGLSLLLVWGVAFGGVAQLVFADGRFDAIGPGVVDLVGPAAGDAAPDPDGGGVPCDCAFPLLCADGAAGLLLCADGALAFLVFPPFCVGCAGGLICALGMF